MNVRNLSTALWFLAGWSGAGLVVGFLALPTWWSLVGGLAAAVIVRWDPSGRLWGARAERRVRPIEAMAAELDGNHVTPGASTGERSGV